MVVEERSEDGGRYGVLSAAFVLEVDDPFTAAVVEVAVSDEVDDVRVVVEQPLAKRRRVALRQPVDHDQPFRTFAAMPRSMRGHSRSTSSSSQIDR